MFLDFAGCTNAAWDHKDLCPAEYQAIRQQLVQWRDAWVWPRSASPVADVGSTTTTK